MMTGFDRHGSASSSDDIEGLKLEFIQKVDSYLQLFGASFNPETWKVMIPQYEIDVFIEPLDDHVSYRNGVERFASGLYLKQEGDLSISAVFVPYFQELYFAEKGRGMKRNNALLSLEKTKSLSKAILTLVLPNTSAILDADVRLMRVLSSQGSQVQMTTSPLFTCSRVINGNIAAAFYRDISEELISLMSHLLTAADGQLFHVDIEGQSYHIAAHQGMKDTLRELVADRTISDFKV